MAVGPFSLELVMTLIGVLFVGALGFYFFIRVWVPRMMISRMRSTLNLSAQVSNFRKRLDSLTQEES